MLDFIVSDRISSFLPGGVMKVIGRWENIEHELDGYTSEMYGFVKQVVNRV